MGKVNWDEIPNIGETIFKFGWNFSVEKESFRNLLERSIFLWKECGGPTFRLQVWVFFFFYLDNLTLESRTKFFQIY